MSFKIVLSLPALRLLLCGSGSQLHLLTDVPMYTTYLTSLQILQDVPYYPCILIKTHFQTLKSFRMLPVDLWSEAVE